jgi:hypothetical protein
VETNSPFYRGQPDAPKGSGKCVYSLAWTIKPCFATVAEARQAIERDKLATIYHTATGVFVVTAYGSGRFSREEWEKP